MYSVTGYQKYQSSLWRSGDAVPVILAHDSITFLLGEYLAQATTLLRYGGFVWFYLLTVSVLLVVLLGRARTVFAGLFIMIHLMLAVSVRIGQFSYVAIAGLVLFLQADFWRDFTTLYNAIGRPGEQLHDRLEAIVQRLTRFLPPGATIRPGSRLVVVILLITGADIGVAVLETTDVIGEDTVPQRAVIDDVKESFGIEQPDWSIFAPNPSTTDSWYIVAAETTDGERYDLHNERPLVFERPGTQLNKQWDTYRERFYWKELEETDVARGYREYLCRGGNDAVGEVASITVYEVTEIIDPDRPATLHDPTARERRIRVLYVGACGDRQPIRLGPTNGSGWG
ncbi:MAG: HTTM domain-containing protein [Halobacteriales archaeon]